MATGRLSDARRQAVCNWLTANGINITEVPFDSLVFIRDRPNGRVIAHDQFRLDALGQRYREQVETPLTVEPPECWPA